MTSYPHSRIVPRHNGECEIQADVSVEAAVDGLIVASTHEDSNSALSREQPLKATLLLSMRVKEVYLSYPVVAFGVTVDN